MIMIQLENPFQPRVLAQREGIVESFCRPAITSLAGREAFKQFYGLYFGFELLPGRCHEYTASTPYS